MGETVQTSTYICPVCGKSFSDIHAYAAHLNEHSTEVKKREAEEQKKRLEDQKKVDTAKVEKLKEAYVAAQEEYFNAKEQYNKKYGITHSSYYFNEDVWNELLERINNYWNNNSWNRYL